jgi:alkanesulfonate monooxygenase SsuD/methylene tetrahydromethanopterin reductase-like flavin-dependent oxidoreductase (luciferase family)
MEARMPELLEALDLQLALWRTSPEAPLTFNGKFYQVRDAVCTPPPTTRPHPPIWFGEAHPLTFAACARYGQGWNSVPVPIEELRRRLDALKAACRDAGRDYDDIEKSLETQILIAPSRDAIRDLLREMLALPTPKYVSPQISRPTDADFAAFIDGKTDVYPHFLADTFLVGTPEEITARLRTYLEMGFSHFMLWFMDAPRQEGMRLFKQQVAPTFQ